MSIFRHLNSDGSSSRVTDIPAYDRGDIIALTSGRFHGHTRRILMGNNPDVDTGVIEDIWPLGGLYPFPAAPVALEVVSTSALDTAIGTGARSVVLELLDVNHVQSFVTVALNGLTPVAVPGTWLRINEALPASAGVTGENQGVVDIRIAGGGTVLGRMPIRACRLHQLVYTVPAAHTFLGFQVVASVEGNSPGSSVTFGGWFRTPNLGVVRTGSRVAVATHYLSAPDLISSTPEKTDITIRAWGATDINRVCWVIVEGLLIANNQIRA